MYAPLNRNCTAVISPSMTEGNMKGTLGIVNYLSSLKTLARYAI